MKEDSKIDEESKSIEVPNELKGKGFGPSRKSSGSDYGTIVPSDSTDIDSSLGHQHSYIQHIHTYVREYISLADKKASFIFAVGSAILVYLYEKGTMSLWAIDLKSWGIAELVSISAISLLSISVSFAISVVFPRLGGSKKGFVFWGSIAQYQSASDFSDRAQRLADNDYYRELLRHTYEIAKICNRKYSLLNWSIRIGSVGAIVAIVIVVTGLPVKS
tara:strand:+ start:12427 stop:13080 length:654 start_codon:yes stop_codon:yes gene_type:complete